MPSLERVAIVLTCLALAACGDNARAPAADDARSSPPADARAPDARPPDAVVAARCDQYPVPWAATPGTEATVTAALAALAPDATHTWNDARGTASSIAQLDLPLPGCTDGVDSGAQVFATLAAHADVFQMDVAEWQPPAPFDCNLITADEQTLSTFRTRIAAHPVQTDFFGYGLRRGKDGVVALSSLSGYYLPTVPPAVDQQLTACNRLTADQAETVVRAGPLRAHVFDLCQPQGDLDYQLQPNDVVAFAPAPTWSWQDDTDRVLLSATRTVRVTIDPANYTPALLSSDARCPVLDPDSEDFTVGFDVTLDVQTGEIQFVKPGLDCVVC